MLFPASVCVDAVVDATGFSPEERNESTTATQSSAANPPITAQVPVHLATFSSYRLSEPLLFWCPRASLGLAGKL